MTMRPLSEFPAEARRAVRFVLCDIDDTITDHGRLPSASLAAMERLQAAGVRVLPITGRPAGWCDHFARMWPVDGVVGENGAMFFRYDHQARRMHRRYWKTADRRAADRVKLDRLALEIPAAVPGAAVAADQPYREEDLAIDFAEDVPRLDDAAIARIVAMFEAAGAVAKVSSIHVNGWFGDFDKLSMTRRAMAEFFGRDIDGKPRRHRLRRRFPQRRADVRLLPQRRRRGQCTRLCRPTDRGTGLDHAKPRRRGFPGTGRGAAGSTGLVNLSA